MAKGKKISSENEDTKFELQKNKNNTWIFGMFSKEKGAERIVMQVTDWDLKTLRELLDRVNLSDDS